MSLGAVYDGATLIIDASGNNTAARYYRIQCTAGRASVDYYNVRFKIDDVNSGWNDPYSGGNRSGLINVTGLNFQHTTVISGAYYDYTSSAYFVESLTTYPTFIFSTPKKVTGIRWGGSGGPVTIRDFRIEAANSSSGPWTTLVESVTFQTERVGYPDAAVATASMWECLFNNDTEYTRYRFVPLTPRVYYPYMLQAIFRIDVTDDDPKVDIAVPREQLRLIGSVPDVTIDNGPIFGLPGELTFTGYAPDFQSTTDIPVLSGELVFSGASPIVSAGASIEADVGSLIFEGQEPGVLTVIGTLASQLGVLAVADTGPPPMRASQVAVMAVAEPPPPPVRASQVAFMAIGEVVPDVCMSQVAALVIGHQTDCVTSLCQIWKITRRDGKVYRYTSLDRDLVFGGKVYKACGSLDPSASDNSSVMGSVGSQTLTGIIRDDGISEAELFGGLFDDAYVTSDLVSFDDPTFVPRRLASGWIGQITQGRVVHSLEVVSIGARIEQQALVRVVSPTCSHKFGDAGCGVNVEAMKIPAEITRVMDRGLFYVSVVNPGEDARQWANGRVRFLDGVNAGVVREFKSIDFATGLLSLWALTGLAPAPGDKIEILPGCDLTREGGCTAYANIINFGGFPDVPGTDAVLETPNAKI